MKRSFAKLIILALLAAAGWLAAALLWPLSPPLQTTVIFPPGAGARTIAHQLAAAGVIRSERAFILLYHARKGLKLRAGEYAFTRPTNTLEVMDRIARGDSLSRTLVIPEGYNMFEIAQAVEGAGLGKASDFLAIAAHDTSFLRTYDPQATSLEGYLFPDTYRFTRTQTMHDIVAAMVRRFQREAAALGLTENVRRTVILASIVEKETAVPEERPLVAGVYVNRLQKSVPLGADPTVIYAAELAGRYRGVIHQSDLDSDSPYNTYHHPGLPPGPIANPGSAALRAALHPAQTPFLFFVAEGDGSGRHRFSSSYREHERNVAAYRKTQK